MQESTTRKETLTNLLVLAGLILISVVFWDRVKQIVMFVVTLGVLVAVHEWGHFIAAKAVGVRVYEFAFGFGPKLVTYMRKNGTDYTIRAIPLGGFVNPKGMQPDDPITPDGLNGRRPAERALVYLAGPMMNMVLAVAVLSTIGFLVGTPDRSKVLIGQVNRKTTGPNRQQSEAARIGLQVGDRILAVNGEPIHGASDVTRRIHPNAGKPVVLRLLRDGKEIEVTGTPKPTTVKQEFLTVDSAPAAAGSLLLQPGDQIEQIDGKHFSDYLKDSQAPADEIEDVFQARAGEPLTVSVWRDGKTFLTLKGTAGPVELSMRQGERTFGSFGFTPVPAQGPRIGLLESVQQGLQQTGQILVAFAYLFSRPKTLGESVGGPIEIFNQMGAIAELPLFIYFSSLAQLSISLAVFNLFPIPVLDGGHLLLLTFEVLRRRRLEPEMQRAAMMVGLAIIGVIFVLIMGNDILKRVL